MDVATDLLDAHLEQINARLPNASPHAAYALGMLTVVHLETRKPIPTVLLDAAMEMGSVAEACRPGAIGEHAAGRAVRRSAGSADGEGSG